MANVICFLLTTVFMAGIDLCVVWRTLKKKGGVQAADVAFSFVIGGIWGIIVTVLYSAIRHAIFG